MKDEKLIRKFQSDDKHITLDDCDRLLVNYGYGIPHSYSVFVGDFLESARREIKPETRHELLNKAVTFGKKGLEHARRAGSTHAINHVSMMLAQALRDLDRSGWS